MTLFPIVQREGHTEDRGRGRGKERDRWRQRQRYPGKKSRAERPREG